MLIEQDEIDQVPRFFDHDSTYPNRQLIEHEYSEYLKRASSAPIRHIMFAVRDITKFAAGNPLFGITCFPCLLNSLLLSSCHAQ